MNNKKVEQFQLELELSDTKETKPNVSTKNVIDFTKYKKEVENKTKSVIVNSIINLTKNYKK